MEIREVDKSAAKEQGYPDPKQEQLDVMEMFVKGHDVLAVLQTSHMLRWHHAGTCKLKLLLSVNLQIRSTDVIYA